LPTLQKHLEKAQQIDAKLNNSQKIDALNKAKD
jgi:hypothetical protein